MRWLSKMAGWLGSCKTQRTTSTRCNPDVRSMLVKSSDLTPSHPLLPKSLNCKQLSKC